MMNQSFVSMKKVRKISWTLSLFSISKGMYPSIFLLHKNRILPLPLVLPKDSPSVRCYNHHFLTKGIDKKLFFGGQVVLVAKEWKEQAIAVPFLDLLISRWSFNPSDLALSFVTFDILNKFFASLRLDLFIDVLSYLKPWLTFQFNEPINLYWWMNEWMNEWMNLLNHAINFCFVRSIIYCTR